MGDRAYFRLGQADWDRFERGSEWFCFSEDEIMDLPCTELEAMEVAMGLPVAGLALAVASKGSRGVRGMFWVARRMAGVQERWADFDPRWMRATIRTTMPEAEESTVVNDAGTGEVMNPAEWVPVEGQGNSEPPETEPAASETSAPFTD